MRLAVTWALLAACSSSSKSPEVVDDHVLHGGIEAAGDAERVHYTGRGVPVKDIPAVGLALGLPVSGTADVAIDVTIPTASGVRDYRRATGTIDVTCSACAVGDDVAKLKPRTQSTRTADFVGDGMYFGRLTVERLEARVEIKDGRAELVHWVAESPDLVLELALSLELASTFDQSTVHGCIRFKAKPELQKRDPKIAALIALTGAPVGSDELFHIELGGSVGSVKRFGHACGAPAKP